MINYIIRRCLYAIPIIIGVNIITFGLFFIVNSPDEMARKMLGNKNVTKESIENWKIAHDYHLPLFINIKESGIKVFTRTIFYQKSVNLMLFNFGKSDRNNIDIGHEIQLRTMPSLTITLPMFILAIFIELIIAMIVAYFRATNFDFWIAIICVTMMSISGLFYIIGGQYFFGKVLRLFPISGYDTGLYSLKFITLPVIIGIISGVGVGIRFYRTIFLEEMNKDYIRTARAKGLSEQVILFKHALKNAMIPILTNAVVVIPFLFMGDLLYESFFSIPGLGNFTLDAINSQDFAIVRSMVFLGSILYIAGLIITDISYTIFDPRVRLE